MRIRQGFILVALLPFTAVANADEVVMKNGSRLVGTLVSSSDSEVVFDTPFAGEIKLKQENIESIVTSEGVTLLMRDGRVFRDQKIVEREGELIVIDQNQAPVEFAIADIEFVNPEPWRLGEGYKWFGQANAALEAERGNSDSDDLDLDFESIWRSLTDRYTMRGLWEVEKTNGDKTKNTWWSRNKYDRFSKTDEDNYYGYQIYFEHDEFADLDLRTLTGPYIGRQFFETDYLTMHAEVGIVYVDEQFDVAEDSDNWGSNWEVRLTSGLIPKTELYLDQAGVLNLNEPSDTIINTTAGIRFPILFGFQAAAEVKYEYDGGAVEGVDDTDKTFNFKLGYAW
jgi:putative salt-induced outer membrane protein YdiY